MSVTQKSVVDMIEIVESGAVQVRTANRILDENGSVISSSFHRHVVIPGDDYSNEDARVQAVCAATHTAEVVAAYQAAQTNVAQPE
jgi:hypothetical protein